MTDTKRNKGLRPKVLVQQLQLCIEANRPALVVGPPGVGKSSVFQQVAAFYNLLYVDIRLAHMDPTEMNGVLSTNADRTRGVYLPMEQFPLITEKLPLLPGETEYKYDEDGDPTNTYDGWLLGFDEITTVPKAVEAAA